MRTQTSILSQPLIASLIFASIAITFQNTAVLAQQLAPALKSEEFQESLHEHQKRVQTNPELAKRMALFALEADDRMKSAEVDVATRAAMRETNDWFRRQMKQSLEPTYRDILDHFLSSRDKIREAKNHIEDPKAFSSGLQQYADVIEGVTSFHPASAYAGQLFGPLNLMINGSDAREKSVEQYAKAYRRSKDMKIVMAETIENSSASPEYRVFADEVIEPIIGMPFDLLDPAIGPLPQELADRPEAQALKQIESASPKADSSKVKNKQPKDSVQTASALFEAAMKGGDFSLGSFAAQLDSRIPPSMNRKIEAPLNQVSQRDFLEIASRNSDLILSAQNALRMSEMILLVSGHSEEANRISTVGGAILSVAVAMNSAYLVTEGFAKFGSIAAGAATFGVATAVAGAVFAISSLFGSQGSSTKAILKELASFRNEMRRSIHGLHNHLNQISAHFDSQFERVMKNQLEILTTVLSGYLDILNGQIEQKAMIERLGIQLAGVDSQIKALFLETFAMAKANDDARFDRSFRDCIRSKDIPLRESSFEDSLNEFVGLSTIRAKRSPYLMSGADPAQDQGFWYTLPLVVSKSYQGLIANPTKWIEGARAFYECTSNRPEHASRVSVVAYEDLIRVGSLTQEALENPPVSDLFTTIQSHDNYLIELQKLIPRAFDESLNQRKPRLMTNQFLPEEVRLGRETVKLRDDLRSHLSKEFAPLDQWQRGTLEFHIRIITNIKKAEQNEKNLIFKNKILPYSEDNKVIDNDFLARWTELQALYQDWYVFKPKKFRPNQAPAGPATNFVRSKEWFLPDYPLINWSFTYLPVEVEINFGVRDSEKFEQITSIRERIEVLIRAEPQNRELNMKEILEEVKAAYSDPKLYDGKDGGKKLDRESQKIVAAEVIELIKDRIQEDHLKKIRVTHLPGQGFKYGPFPLHRLRHSPDSAEKQIEVFLSDSKLQKSWIKRIKIPESLTAELKQISKRRHQEALIATTGVSEAASVTQNNLELVYQALDQSKEQIERTIKMTLSQPSLMSKEIADYALGSDHAKIWGRPDFIHAIQNLNEPQDGQHAETKTALYYILNQARLNLYRFKQLVKSREIERKSKGLPFGERFNPIDQMLLRLCIGYGMLSAERGHRDISEDIREFCGPFLKVSN